LETGSETREQLEQIAQSKLDGGPANSYFLTRKQDCHTLLKDERKIRASYRFQSQTEAEVRVDS
jgi:predicted nucleic acid-binding protein